MRQETSKRSIPIGVLVALAGALALLSAGPARANNDFQNGFEDQLGRIAAFGAVNLGLQVLSGGAPYGVAYYPPSYAYGYVRPYPVRYVVQHQYVHPHQHGRYCGHGYHRWHDDNGWRGRGRGHGRGW